MKPVFLPFCNLLSINELPPPPRAFLFRIDVVEVETAIEDVCGSQVGSHEIYDLAGRRVSGITKSGFYIVNGKKQLVNKN